MIDGVTIDTADEAEANSGPIPASEPESGLVKFPGSELYKKA